MMKKKSLLNFWLLLLCMIAGAGTAWGDEGDTHDYPRDLQQLLNNNATISSINIAEPSYPIKKVVVSYRYNKTIKNAVTVTVSVGGNDWGSQYVEGTGNNYSTLEFSGDATKGNVVVSFTNNTGSGTGHGTFYVNNVRLVEGSSEDPSLEDNDLALTGAPITLNFDLYNNSTAQVINYTTSSSGAVTVSESEYVTTAVDTENNTITVTPKTSVTPSAQTITVSQAADATYKSGSATFTVSITDSTPLPIYTVTFSDGGSVTQESYGASVTLPSRDDVDEYTFAGWSENNIASETTTAPTIIPAGSYIPTGDITLYPVYTRTEGGGGSQNKSADVTISDYADAHNWSSASKYTTVTLDENITATASGSNNTGKYYTTGESWRIYSSETGKLILTANNGAEFTSATISFANSTLSYNSKNITSGSKITVSGNSLEFVAGGTTYITAISVEYTISGGGTTYYYSNPVAAAVARPVITVAENPFLFSTTATITCDTEGADIKYSFDGEDWNDYTEALTITETKTIYAKAVKDENESNVASVTATKNLAEPTVTIDATGITNTNVFEGTEAGSLSASVTYNEADVEGAVVAWSGNNDEVATINASTGVVTLVSAGSVTFTATYAGNGDYSEKTATYEMTVTNSDPNAPGTENNPYTVAQARAAIDAGDGITDVYATGVVSSIATAFSSQHNNISYYISADGLTTSDQLQIYRGSCSSEDEIRVGDVVVVKGNLTKYGSIYEFAAGSTLQSLKLVAPTFSEEAGAVLTGTEVTIADLHTDATIYYTTDGTEPTAESTEYTSAITINSTTTIKAIAVKDGYTNSDVVTAEYTIAAQAATPTFSPAAGTYTSIQNVTISTETEDATIYYTIDGTTPTEESTVYTEAITVAETMTIKAIAVKDGMVNSEVAEAAYTINVPSIVVAEASVNASATESEGTIEVTYNFIASDPEIVWYTDNTCAEATTKPDWIFTDFDASNNIEYVIEANTGEARTAYLKVYGLDDEANDVYSALITISQAEYVAPTTYTLVTSITPGKHYIITNGTNAAMGYDKGNNRYAADVTISEGTATVEADNTDVYEFVIYGPDANGYYAIYDVKTPGYLYAASNTSNSLKTQETNNANGKWSISIGNGGVASIVAQGSYSRNVMQYNSSSSIFSCYGSASQSDVYLYVKDGEATPTVNVTLAASGYASYCSPLALDLTPTEDYAAWAVTDATSSTVTFTKITGAVPAETPFILYGKEFGDQTATLSVATGETTAVSNNMLVGTLKPTAVTTVNGNYTNFALSGGVFVKMSNGTVPANKAYLPILTSVISSSSRLSIVFNDETTGISEVKEVTNVRGEYYNLNGQRVENLKKGNLYIVNGKKILVK